MNHCRGEKSSLRYGGQVTEQNSRFADATENVRAIANEYDQYDRLMKTTCDATRSEAYTCDTWEQLPTVTATDGESVRVAIREYDDFGRQIARRRREKRKI